MPYKLSVQIKHVKINFRRRFTKCTNSKLPYEIRLKNLNLTSIETRRIWGDMIEVYIIMNGIEGLIGGLKATYDANRGRIMKLEENVMSLDVNKHFFTKSNRLLKCLTTNSF